MIKIPKQWAETHGYATMRKNHSKDKFNEIRKIWVIFDKGGEIRSIKPLNSGEPQQQQQDNEVQNDGDDDTQRKTGSEFKLTITRTPDNKWVVKVLNDTHNDEPSLQPSAHPSHRKLARNEEKLLKSMADRTAKPRDILLAIWPVVSLGHL